MLYLRIRWIHHLPDEPVLLYSEIDEDRYEVRKVEEYADGHCDVASVDGHTGSTYLGEVPTPGLSAINAQEDFVALEISSEEFEQVWAEALR